MTTPRTFVAPAVALALATLAPLAHAEDWPQWRGANRDGVWRETGIVQKFAAPEIKVKWRVPVGNGYSGPTVANGRVYVSDRQTEPKSQERVHCFDASTGKPVWSYAYDCSYAGISYPNGPRASVTVSNGRAFSLGARGHLHCFDAATGKVLWGLDLDKDYKIRLPDWGIAAAPIVVGQQVIAFVGGEGKASVLAFDVATGKERWRALEDRASYSAPVLIQQAKKPVLICWTAEGVVGLDPATGKEHWRQPFPSEQTVDAVATPVIDKDWLFVSSTYEGSMMLKLHTDKLGVEKVWAKKSQNPRITDSLHSLISTPALKNGYIYGINYFGELRCLDARTGDKLWEETSIVPRANWAAAHLIQQGDKTWIFNEKGQLIIAKLSPKGYQEISRALLIKPTRGQLNQRGGVAWAHPAFANQHVFARNDEELICASLKEGDQS